MQPDLAPSCRGADAAQGRWPARLRGFGPLGLVAMALIPFAGTAFIGALLVFLWAHLSRTPLREIGFVWPRNWKLAIAAGVMFGVLFKLVMKALVMPSLGASHQSVVSLPRGKHCRDDVHGVICYGQRRFRRRDGVSWLSFAPLLSAFRRRSVRTDHCRPPDVAMVRGNTLPGSGHTGS